MHHSDLAGMMLQRQVEMSLQRITYQMHPDTRKMFHKRHTNIVQMILWANPTVEVF
jgi:hypothetical protein